MLQLIVSDRVFMAVINLIHSLVIDIVLKRMLKLVSSITYFHLCALSILLFFGHGKRDLAVYVIHAHFQFFFIRLKVENRKFTANFAP